jgi:hypothetical protein
MSIWWRPWLVAHHHITFNCTRMFDPAQAALKFVAARLTHELSSAEAAAQLLNGTAAEVGPTISR